MCDIYTPTKQDTPNNLSALAIGVLSVIAVFALLPILTQIPNFLAPPPTIPVVTTPVEIPDFNFLEDPPAVIDEKDIVKPDLEIPPPIFDIHQLELLINPGDGGVTVNTGWGTTITAEDTNIDVFLPSQLDQQPRVLVAANPLYPYSMKGINGQVIVEFVIDADGRVKRPRVVKTSHREFEQAAINAVLKSKWQPGQKDGANVQTLVRLPVNFKK